MKFPERDATEHPVTRQYERFSMRRGHNMRLRALPWIRYLRSDTILNSELRPQPLAGNVAAAEKVDNSIGREKAQAGLLFHDLQTGHLRRIIVGHDLKCGGDHALQSALVFAEQFNASIRLVHVVNPHHHLYATALAKGRHGIVEELVTRSGRELEQIVGSHKACHAHIDYDVRVGKPAMELVLAGRAWQCDLIMIGGSARPSIHFLKSTTERLIRMAFVPVLVARQPLRYRPQRFLIPTDFSPTSHRAAEEGVALAKCFGGRLFFLHVFDSTPWYSCPYGDDMMSPVMIPELNPADLKQEWTKLLRGLSLDSLTWQTRTDEGLPVTGIVQYADVMRADMIIIGAHGRTAWERILVGSVAEGVVRAASCPVLTIKPDVAQFRLS